MTAHIPIVGDIRLVLSELAAKVENNVSQDWIDRVFGLKAKYPPRGEAREDCVEPRVFIRDLSAMMKEDAILTADVGQNQIWAARNFNVKEGRFLTSGALAPWVIRCPRPSARRLPNPTVRL